MRARLFHSLLIVPCLIFIAGIEQASAKTLCVNPKGFGCYSTIQSAVNAAGNGDVIKVGPGVYPEEVTIGKPVSLLGASAAQVIIEASNLAHGIFVDGYDYPGLKNVTIAGLTVRGALFEGILVVSASHVNIKNNNVVDNDSTSGLSFTGALTGCPNQPGSGIYETDETGDCGGAIHLVGTSNSIVSGNTATGNADGILLSDETAESHGNLITRNVVVNNPLECGIVFGSHPPAGQTMTVPLPPHNGINNNIVSDNIAAGNGVQVGGSGVGLFSDGAGPGTVSGNLIKGNQLTGNGIPGVAFHSHVGPAFGAPADNFSGNVVINNIIAGNGADTADTATPGPTGININSGGGGSPINGTIISGNVITDEDVAIAVNDPAELDANYNDLLNGQIGVANVCALDNAACTGTINATENFWGCTAGPGNMGCASVSGSNILYTPWLTTEVNQ
jgi:parallel beta-helix repeat protein